MEVLAGGILRDDIVFYTIYFNPIDYPNKYVLRQWIVRQNETPFANLTPTIVADDLNTVREHPALRHKSNLGRYADDDPCIVETYL